MLERLLERVSLSKYKKQFILKGGMLIAAMVGIDTRSTMDMDATIRGFTLTEEKLKECFNAILSVSLNDNVKMGLSKIESIRGDDDYPGFRISIESLFDETKQIMKVDITAGDKITPRAIEYEYKLLLEDRTISVLAYNLETLFAEKIENILSRGTTNTRMRDYYDIYILMKLYELKLDVHLLKKAFRETSKYRGSFGNVSKNYFENIQMIESSEVLLNLWERYRTKNDYASDIKWGSALDSVRKVINKTTLF